MTVVKTGRSGRCLSLTQYAEPSYLPIDIEQGFDALSRATGEY